MKHYEFIVIVQSKIDRFEEDIKKHLYLGYKFHGDFIVSPEIGTSGEMIVWYYQAMVLQDGPHVTMAPSNFNFKYSEDAK